MGDAEGRRQTSSGCRCRLAAVLRHRRICQHPRGDRSLSALLARPARCHRHPADLADVWQRRGDRDHRSARHRNLHPRRTRELSPGHGARNCSRRCFATTAATANWACTARAAQTLRARVKPAGMTARVAPLPADFPQQPDLFRLQPRQLSTGAIEPLRAGVDAELSGQGRSRPRQPRRLGL